jgi:hypothetical protein
MSPYYSIIMAGILAFAIVRICPERRPPCPRISWKHLLAILGGLIGAAIYFGFVGFKPFTEGIHFLNSQVAGVALGCAIYGIFCPLE